MLRQIIVSSTFVMLAAGLPAAAQAQAREGFWIGAGVGYGSVGVGCDVCSGQDRESGSTGYLRGGWTLNQRTLVGIDFDLWSKTVENDVELNLYNLTGSLTFYPSVTSGFFVKAGAGISTIDSQVDNATLELGKGFGLTTGAGYDIRLGRMISLTPAVGYWYGHPGDLRVGPATLLSNWHQDLFEFTIGITFH
jgi:hypothetical protein